MTTLQELMKATGAWLSAERKSPESWGADLSQILEYLRASIEEPRWTGLHDMLRSVATALELALSEPTQSLDIRARLERLYRDLALAGVSVPADSIPILIQVGKATVHKLSEIGDQAFEQLCKDMLIAEHFLVEENSKRIGDERVDFVVRPTVADDRWIVECKIFRETRGLRATLYRLHANMTLWKAAVGLLIVTGQEFGREDRSIAEALGIHVWADAEIYEILSRHPQLLAAFGAESTKPSRAEFYVEALSVVDYRGFETLNIEFDRHENVIVGINGSGKSSILDALACTLNWYLVRLTDSKRRAPIPEATDIRTGQSECDLRVTALIDGERASWSIIRRLRSSRAELSEMVSVATRKREALSGDVNDSLPVFIYYSATRPTRISVRGKPMAQSRLAIYAHSLESRSDYGPLIKWFREREDIENERRTRRNSSFRDPQLESLRHVMSDLLPQISNPRIQRPRNNLIVDKQGHELDFSQLSSGERTLVALAADITWRLMAANPSMTQPSHGSGVVLIDEIELHLHPSWQRAAIRQLRKAFPNLQFIVTTHSPQVLSSVPSSAVRALDGSAVRAHTAATQGRDSNSILLDVMGVSTFPQETQVQLQAIGKAIDADDLDTARSRIDALAGQLGENDNEIVRLRALVGLLGD